MIPFSIDPGIPVANSIAGGIADDLADAIQVAFPMDCDDAILNWQGLEIRISYKYDLSVMLEDVLDMLEHCLSGTQDSTDVIFGSDTFHCTWSLQPSGDKLALTGKWFDVRGDREAELNALPSFIVPLRYFVDQWRAILCPTLQIVLQLGIRIRNPSLTQRLRALCGKKD